MPARCVWFDNILNLSPQTLDAAIYTLELRMEEAGQSEAVKTQVLQVRAITVLYAE